LLDYNTFGGDPETGGGDLRERCVRSLPDRGTRRLDVHPTVVAKPDA
jgi:hypothetical protein